MKKQMLRWFGFACVSFGLLSLGTYAFGAALTGNKAAQSRDGAAYTVANVASGQVIYAGGMVAIWTNNYAYPASDTEGMRVCGVAVAAVDNRAGVYDSAKKVSARRSVFLFVNSGTNIALQNVGDWAYVSDDQTVTTAASATYDIIAGTIVDVDSKGVWVDIGGVSRYGAVSASGLTVTGDGSFSSDVTVDGSMTVAGAQTNSGTLRVTGASTLGALTTSGTTTLGGTTVAVTNNATVAGTLGVTGKTTLAGGVTKLDVGADITQFTVATNGNTAVGGTLGVTGRLTLGAGTSGSTNAQYQVYTITQSYFGTNYTFLGIAP